MKEIPLTKGKVTRIVDDRFEDVNSHKWYACYCRGKWYARRDVTIDGKRKQIYMHKYIGEKLGFDTMQVIDHRNGDGLDNQDHNLRGATRGENMANRKGWGNSSRFTGVFPTGEKFLAKIGSNGDSEYLGTFEKEIDAALAYDRRAVELFGEFAKTNFPF